MKWISCSISGLVVLAVSLCFISPTVSMAAVSDAHCKRIALIASCSHGSDQQCPLGRTWFVDGTAARASDWNDATEAAPLKTISAAASRALPGDTILVSQGVYREYVAPANSGYDPNHMITYAARPGNRVVIKGSQLWNSHWRKVDIEGVNAPLWQGDLDPMLVTSDFPIENFNPFHITGLGGKNKGTVEEYYRKCRPVDVGEQLEETRGMIFVDGRPLRELRSTTEFNSGQNLFMVGADGRTITIRLDSDASPVGKVFEVACREQVFAPKGSGRHFIRIKGFTIEHAANGPGYPQFGMLSTTAGLYWIIEDNIVRWAHTVGANVGINWYTPIPWRQGYRVKQPHRGKLSFDIMVRRNEFSNNGTAGLWCMAKKSVLIEDSTFERNGWRGIKTWEEAGLKFHSVMNSVIRRNFFHENYRGLWLDVCKDNNRVTQNLFVNNISSGVFIEGMIGPTLVDNNIVAYTNPGSGFYSHHASNVIFAHNLSFGNSAYGYQFLLHSRQRVRQFPDQIAHVSHNRVLNNIAYANGLGAVSMPFDQDLCTGNHGGSNFVWGLSAPPLFYLQRGILDIRDVAKPVSKLLQSNNLPYSQAPDLDTILQPDADMPTIKHAGVAIGIRLWRMFVGRGVGTIVGSFATFKMYDQTLQLDINNAKNSPILTDVKCQRLPYVNHDYFGHPRPANEPPTVGPFQSLKLLGLDQGRVRLRLWPNNQDNWRDARELQIDIEPIPVK